MTKDRLKCPRPKCGHEWYPRVKNPVECPKCKHYSDNWDIAENTAEGRVDSAGFGSSGDGRGLSDVE